jgi:hypothetical protein
MLLRCFLPLALAMSLANACAADLVSRAQDFMQAYARDLAAGDRQAVAGRYSRRGAIFVSSGRKEVLSLRDIAADYEKRWQAPLSFRWQQLAYEILGEQSVLVTGEFLWQAQGSAAPKTFGYVAVLMLEDGELRIRLEDETPQAPN